PRFVRSDGHLQRREHAFDLRARGFVPWRKDQRVAEVRGIFIDGEPGPLGRDLEENAAGLLEGHRLEPEAIYHRRRPARRGEHQRPATGRHACNGLQSQRATTRRADARLATSANRIPCGSTSGSTVSPNREVTSSIFAPYFSRRAPHHARLPAGTSRLTSTA